MKINISGSIELGQNFPEYVDGKFEKEVSKYFTNQPVADVHLNKQNNIVHANITVNGSKINADGEDTDVYKAFDEALKKLIEQLRKEKDKLIAKKKKGE
ncbi:MAG: ribosome-associated translation inhibitor RaiA [Rickettsiales bacterium]|nr:ribosome-associated translation inhibitor RaiA [Rickettsiales bacterium]